MNVPSGSVLPFLWASAMAAAAFARRAELVGVRGVALLQLIPVGLDAVLDIGDGRGQRGDRAVDVGGRAVDGVQQRTRLSQRRFRGADRVDQTGLLAHRPGDQARAVEMF